MCGLAQFQPTFRQGFELLVAQIFFLLDLAHLRDQFTAAFRAAWIAGFERIERLPRQLGVEPPRIGIPAARKRRQDLQRLRNIPGAGKLARQIQPQLPVIRIGAEQRLQISDRDTGRVAALMRVVAEGEKTSRREQEHERKHQDASNDQERERSNETCAFLLFLILLFLSHSRSSPAPTYWPCSATSRHHRHHCVPRRRHLRGNRGFRPALFRAARIPTPFRAP